PRPLSGVSSASNASWPFAKSVSWAGASPGRGSPKAVPAWFGGEFWGWEWTRGARPVVGSENDWALTPPNAMTNGLKVKQIAGTVASAQARYTTDLYDVSMMRLS